MFVKWKGNYSAPFTPSRKFSVTNRIMLWGCFPSAQADYYNKSWIHGHFWKQTCWEAADLNPGEEVLLPTRQWAWYSPNVDQNPIANLWQDLNIVIHPCFPFNFMEILFLKRKTQYLAEATGDIMQKTCGFNCSSAQHWLSYALFFNAKLFNGRKAVSALKSLIMKRKCAVWALRSHQCMSIRKRWFPPIRLSPTPPAHRETSITFWNRKQSAYTSLLKGAC